jgi:rhodanese-related sulfurtransferase
MSNAFIQTPSDSRSVQHDAVQHDAVELDANPAASAAHTIGREELARKLHNHEPFTLLEALPERYYRKAHLPGAHLMPHDRVAELAPELIPSRSQDIVVYCASDTCQSSHIAAAELTRLGYGSVRVYVGGKSDWQAHGLPTES